MNITLYVIQELMTPFMYRARMTVNTYDFNETINVTYITWTSVKPTRRNIVTLTL